MVEDRPHTWHNENWVIERLIEAVAAGDAVTTEHFGQRLLDGINDDNWSSWKFVDEGFFIPFTSLDPNNMLDEDSERMFEERGMFEERRPGGRSPIGRELVARWRELVLQNGFAPDCATFWMILQFRSRNGGKVYVAGARKDTGRTPWMAANTFVAAHSTYSDTLNCLKAQGFVGRKDYEARWAEIFGDE